MVLQIMYRTLAYLQCFEAEPPEEDGPQMSERAEPQCSYQAEKKEWISTTVAVPSVGRYTYELLTSVAPVFDSTVRIHLPVSTSFAALVLVTGLSVWRFEISLRSELLFTDYYSTILLYKPDTVYISYKTRAVILMLSFVLTSSVCLNWLLYYSTFPKSSFTSSPFKIPCTQMIALLVLCLGNAPISGHTIPQLSVRLARQTQTVWTLQIKGWPNTGYCAMMRFGIDQQQTVSTTVDQILKIKEIHFLSSSVC